MNAGETARLAEVWREVSQWPPRVRLSMASKILQSLETEDVSAPPDDRTLSDLAGAWKTDQPCDDEEIERILDDERLRKHG
jgi:hypothetical protein